MDESKSNKEEGLLTTALKKNRKPGKCPIYFEKKKEGDGVNAIVNFTGDTKKDAQDCYNELLGKLTGTNDLEMASEIIHRGRLCILGNDEAYQKNVILQSLADQQPRDAHEARLCAQATALFSQGMFYLQRAENVLWDDTAMAKDHWNIIFMNNATRLLNLHAKTIEALTRYRQKGEQRITVVHQNVNVEGGGKAIVNNSVAIGEGNTKSNEVAHGQPGINSDVSGKIQEVGKQVPQLCHERQTCLSDAWREKHRVENT